MIFSSKITNPSHTFGNKHNEYEKPVFYANHQYFLRYELQLFNHRHSCALASL